MKDVDYFNAGMEHYKNKHYQEAIENFSSAIASNMLFIRAYIYRANSYIVLGKYKTAIKDFDMLLKINPGTITAYIGKITCNLKLEKFADVIDDCNKLMQFAQEDKDLQQLSKQELDNFFSNIYLNRGLGYKGLGDSKFANKDFDMALRLNPKNSQAHDEMGK